MKLLDWLLYGGSFALRAYEAGCIECLIQKLPGEAQSILERQVRLAYQIQRFSNEKLVVIHYRQGPHSDPVPLFPNRTDELHAARLILRATSSRRRIRCDIVFARGRLFSLQYNKPPKAELGAGYRCENVEMCADLLSPASQVPQVAVAPVGEVLSRLSGEFDVTDTLPGKPQDHIQAFVAGLGAALPEDYVRLLGECDGFRSGGWSFYGTRARRIVLPNENLWLAAEDDASQWALCFVEDEDEPVVYLYSEIDDEKTRLGAGFVEALIAQLRQPPEDE